LIKTIREALMRTTQTLDLHVKGFIRMRGGVIYREPTPMVTDFLGYVGAKLLHNGKRMYLLEPGLYMVQFEEEAPLSIDNSTIFNVRQHDLNITGAYLSLNTNPWEGVLQVFYPMQIEENSRLASLAYMTLPDNIISLSIPPTITVD
jgi:hypothetical protein